MGPTSTVSRRILLVVNLLLSLALVAQPASAAGPPDKADAGLQNALDHLNSRARAYGLANHAPPTDPSGTPVLDGFELVGHNALGARDTNADVWVHDGYAYVGTWAFPCTGRGVKIIDVTDPTSPRAIGSAAARRGTSAEDMVVRQVETAAFVGDLMAVGIQRCGRQGGPRAMYGVEFWDVSDPRHPRRLSEFATSLGGGGVHELDMVVRGGEVYAALAVPFNEWFDPSTQGDVFIVNVTNPRVPFLVSEWGVVENSPPQPGPFYGLGSFGAAFAHSVRFSDDGMTLYVSYWDRGVITLNVANPAAPYEVTHTQYADDVDGDLHSLVPYSTYLLTNDEDFDPRSPAHVTYGDAGFGIANESPFTPPLWEVGPSHTLAADVVTPANQGCDAADYAGIDATDAIVVVQTPFSFFADAGALCPAPAQEAVAEAAGGAVVVHRFDSSDTSPQFFDFSEATIPVLFTDTATADGMVAAGSATLEAQEPTWGFLRVYDAATGAQLQQFDDVPNINDLSAAGSGFWSIHNTEVSGDTAYSSWYSNGIVALDLSGLPGPITRLGRFVPPGDFPSVWGVFIDEGSGLIYASDEGSGLWIVDPTFDD